MSLDFMLHDLHTHCTDLVMNNDGMELGEAREAEEDVHYVGRQLRAFLPVFSQHS